MAERTTLRQVAEFAGVSLGTASQALGNKTNVLPETRTRVLEAAAALGYKQPVRTVVSVNKALNTIGLLTKRDSGPPPALNPFYSYILSGAEHECQRLRISLMYATVKVDEGNRPQELPAMLLEEQVDGLIVVGTFLEEAIAEISKQATPNVVLVDAYAPSQPFDSVVIDNLDGAQTAIEYLITQGHRHIGLVGSQPDGYPSIRERRKGYTRTLRDHHIPDTYIEDTPLTRDGGYEGTLRLLQRAPEITAIFACNDVVAFGAMYAARELGRDIPDDLSVVGFDDIDPAQGVVPPLTTVHVDKVLMGALAVRHLQSRAMNPGQTPVKTLVSTRLIERKSVRAINGAGSGQ
ncbi:MAG: LacI family DNA-binding transcriptional regulator [Aggregatilineales bacterium]